MSPNVCSIHTTLVQAVTIGNEQKIGEKNSDRLSKKLQFFSFKHVFNSIHFDYVLGKPNVGFYSMCLCAMVTCDCAEAAMAVVMLSKLIRPSPLTTPTPRPSTS